MTPPTMSSAPEDGSIALQPTPKPIIVRPAPALAPSFLRRVLLLDIPTSSCGSRIALRRRRTTESAVSKKGFRKSEIAAMTLPEVLCTVSTTQESGIGDDGTADLITTYTYDENGNATSIANDQDADGDTDTIIAYDYSCF